MQDKNYRIVNLIQRFLVGELLPEEAEELEAWISEKEGRQQWFENICKGHGVSERNEFFKNLDADDAYLCFRRRTVSRKINWKYYLNYAAVGILLLAVGTFFLLRKPSDTSIQTSEKVGTSNYYKAFLTLNDGEQVFLTADDSSRFLQNGVKVSDGGRSISCEAESRQESSLSYHTLSTPRGGEYGVRLSDSSWVHLNAATELQFPKHFIGTERVVRLLSGEAFFQVAKDQNRPFYVEIHGVRIRVYGTQFNVSVQEDGDIETVLVEGSVGIESNHVELCKMEPGQLSLISDHGTLLDLKNVDVEPYIAWTKGFYSFDEVTLEVLMDKLSLWYDTDVIFNDPELRNHTFTGRIEKYQGIETILKSLEYITGYDFNYKNHKLSISR